MQKTRRSKRKISTDRFWVISNYNHTPDNLTRLLSGRKIIFNQGISDLCSLRSQNTQIVQSLHTGHNLSDYLQWIIENYHNLPAQIGFLKGNIVPRHITLEKFNARLAIEGRVSYYGEDATFKPNFHWLLLYYFVSQQIAPGLYIERSNNWYIRKKPPGRLFPKLNDLHMYLFSMNAPRYVGFVPGAVLGCTCSDIRRFPLDVYKALYTSVTYSFFPVEAYHLERLWAKMLLFPRD